MTQTAARVAMHSVHLLAFLLLLSTGMLLLLPSLRAELVGGYSLLLQRTHRWGGVAFVVLPALVVGRYGVRAVFAPAAQRTLRSMWQGLHVAITIVLSLVFTVTGFVVWGRRSLPDEVVELSRWLHDELTYVAAGLVMIHIGEVGLAAITARVSAAAAGSTEKEGV